MTVDKFLTIVSRTLIICGIAATCVLAVQGVFWIADLEERPAPAVERTPLPGEDFLVNGVLVEPHGGESGEDCVIMPSELLGTDHAARFCQVGAGF